MLDKCMQANHSTVSLVTGPSGLLHMGLSMSEVTYRVSPGLFSGRMEPFPGANARRGTGSQPDA